MKVKVILNKKFKDNYKQLKCFRKFVVNYEQAGGGGPLNRDISVELPI